MFTNLFQGFGGGAGGFGFQQQPATFQQTYRCRSVAFHKPEMEQTGKICLPPSALDMLMRLSIQYPMLFEVLNPKTQQLTHCGVLEFTADEGVCYMPYWMMQGLFIEEGGFVDVRNVTLPRGTFVKLQPHSKRFLEISDPKAVLEIALRNYSCLTQGEVIAFYYLNEPYYMNVAEVKPSTYNAISIVETDLQLDFLPPLDYVDPSSNNNGKKRKNIATAAATSGQDHDMTGSAAAATTTTPSGSSSSSSSMRSAAPSAGRRLDGKSGTAVHTSSSTGTTASGGGGGDKPVRMKTVIRGGQLVQEPVMDDDSNEDDDDSSSSSNSSNSGGGGGRGGGQVDTSNVSGFVPFSGKGRSLKD